MTETELFTINKIWKDVIYFKLLTQLVLLLYYYNISKHESNLLNSILGFYLVSSSTTNETINTLSFNILPIEWANFCTWIAIHF